MCVTMLLICVVLSLTVGVSGQFQDQTYCPSAQQIVECTDKYVSELNGRFTTPTRQLYDDKLHYIAPIMWTFEMTREVCKVKDNYILYLECALNLKKSCVLNDQRDVFMTRDRIARSVDLLCEYWKCDRCDLQWCDNQCGPEKVFNFDCMMSRIPEYTECTRAWNEEIYRPEVSSDFETRRWHFNYYYCNGQRHVRECWIKALEPCGFYSQNLTFWYSEFARPFVCSAPSVTISSALAGIVAILHFFKLL